MGKTTGTGKHPNTVNKKIKTTSDSSAIKNTASGKTEPEKSGNKKNRKQIQWIKNFWKQILSSFIVGLLTMWIMAAIAPFEWISNPRAAISYSCGLKYENQLDSLYKKYPTNYKDMLPLVEKLKNKEKFKDAYNFYQGYYLAKSDVKYALLKHNSPEDYLKSISSSSKYYDDSKMILFLYYYTMYKDGKTPVDFFTDNLRLQIDKMREDNKIGYPYHYFRAQYGYFKSNISISDIYGNYNYMQRTFQITFNPPYIRCPGSTISRESKITENEIKDYLEKNIDETAKSLLIQYYYIISILQKHPQNADEEKIQKELIPFLLFADQNDFDNYYTGLAYTLMMFAHNYNPSLSITDCLESPIFSDIISNFKNLYDFYYAGRANNVNFEKDGFYKNLVKNK